MVDTAIAAQQALTGQRRGLRAVTPFLGPAFIAAVAYVDPGNFATNMAGGAQFGYALGWVVLAANLMAMLVQTLSAKLGIATGMSLPEVCRERLPLPDVRLNDDRKAFLRQPGDMRQEGDRAFLLFLVPLLFEVLHHDFPSASG